MDKTALRRALLQTRQTLPQRANCNDALSCTLRQWLQERSDSIVGAYWPIRGEFDPKPCLLHWQQEGSMPRQIALPVMDARRKTLAFHAWHPGCPMTITALGIPEPQAGVTLQPEVLLVPCVGCAPGGWRLGYGGGFYDRTLATMQPRPVTVGLCYSANWLTDFTPGPHDVPLDFVISDSGVLWAAEHITPAAPADTGH